jgi:hypothetical protein
MNVSMWIKLMENWKELPRDVWRDKIISCAPGRPKEWERWHEARVHVMTKHRIATPEEWTEWMDAFSRTPSPKQAIERCPFTLEM